MKKIKVCHISTVHSVRDIRIFYKECRTLAANGYDVTYISQGVHDEVIDGVRRLGTGKPIIKNKLVRMTLGCRHLIKIALAENADIYHIHDSELLRFSRLLKKAGKIVVYDSHEHLPMQIMEKEWIPRPIRPLIAKITGKIELRKIQFSDLIIVVADKTFHRFENKGIELIKLENFPIFNEFYNIDIDYNKKKSHRKICYTGAIWLERGLDTMCKAAAGLENCTLEIAGRIDHPSHNEYISGIGDNIVYSGYISRADIVTLYEESMVGLCLFKAYPNNMIDPPTKIFEYMASGIPVIGSAFDSIMNVVEKYECGLCVNPLDINEIRKAMQFLVDNPEEAKRMGINGRRVVKEKMNWEVHSDVLLNAYGKLMEKRNG